VLGHRHPDDAEDTVELDLVDPMITRVDARALRARGAAATAADAVRALSEACDAVWLHIDLDVLDHSELPAVSYPQPGGIGWDDLETLTAPLAHSPQLGGISVADLNSEKDPDGRYARRVVELLESATA
jgi:arginase